MTENDQPLTSRRIRTAFLDFFKEKEHQIVPSAPIVVKNDPTLMFTNAGMNQFKAYFLGEEIPKSKRVADTQRCLRVSGKHNDLDEVGIDTYHHTMFEMLGNWSFGDYFKQEAIAWSWELLTSVYGLEKDRLYVTIFEGDQGEGLPRDQEAYDCWKQHIPEERILNGNKKDNFWEMGDVGPCGPCSEIHYDCRPDNERRRQSGAELVNADHPQVIEIWNNVFMQFNRQADGRLVALPAKHVDTGMGFERLVRIIQGKDSNYDTDVFQPLIQFIAAESSIAYGKSEDTDIAMRVMSDHIRAIAFAIADGQLPSNNKAGYVIRRILRRAVRYAYTFLDFREPVLYRLVPILADQFQGVFTELEDQRDFVAKVIREEELAFLRTLTTGISRFERYESAARQIEGGFAFELYDTFGFPIDLTQLMAREKGWTVDMAGFQEELEQQKNRSRKATASETGDWVLVNPDLQELFVGYDALESETRIIKYRSVKQKNGLQYQLVLSETPFYAEGVGQVGDQGTLMNTAGEMISVLDTKKENGLFIHMVNKLPDQPEAIFQAKVDEGRRRRIEANHSATHLLQAALRKVLGEHVAQKGSLVNDQLLRFDFAHFNKVSPEEWVEIEQLVNQKIRENIVVEEQRALAYDQALADGATALFGEKYGDTVRVITMEAGFSKELCGGTHVRRTGDIGYFRLQGEGAVAAGVRRIEAFTGDMADALAREQSDLLNAVREALKAPKDVLQAVQGLLQENNRLKKELEGQLAVRLQQLSAELKNKSESVGGIDFLAQQVEVPNAEALKSLAFSLKNSLAKPFIVLAAAVEGKPLLAVVVADELVAEGKLHAGNIVRELSKLIKGGGGGQPFFATAGGKDVSGIGEILSQSRTFIK